MRSNSMLTATMALLALISASVTASPIMNIIDRISGEFGEESNNVLSTMRDIDITDRNMEDWWTQYDIEIKGFKNSLGGKSIETENPDANPLVCTKHKEMMDTLNKVKTQWGKVWSAWEAKNELLNLIWGILNDDTKENKNKSGLHCKADGQAGAAKQLCTLLRNLKAKSEVEKKKLKAEEATIDKYIKNVTEYKCDCTFADWDSDFGQCAGPKVEKVDIYETCENAETMKESEGNLKCKPAPSFCGEGKHSKTRTRRWDAKDGGEGKTGKKCQVGSSKDGVYSEVDKNEQQTLTKDCKAGEYEGNCPIDCQWGEWSNGGSIETAACPAKSCSDKDKKQRIIREKTKERKFGGKFCFKDEKGHYSTHETPCSFETTATLAQNKITHDKDKYEALVKVLKEEMCKGGNGPCGENGNCKVEIDDDGKLTSWCKCTAGYKGKWCEQAQVAKKSGESGKNACNAVSLTVAGRSGVYRNNEEKWGARLALTAVSNTWWGYWHSWEEKKPWIAFKMAGPTKQVVAVRIEGRKNCCHDRHELVEVTVGDSPDINSKGRTSCGIQSYDKTTKLTFFKYDCPAGTRGQYVFIQKLEKAKTPYLQINHVEVDESC